MIHSYVASPVGMLLLTGDGQSLTGLYTEGHGRLPANLGERRDADFAEVHEQLGQYFAGERAVFDLPLAPIGTAFQQRVWQRLQAITFGGTRSYGQLAMEVGNPKAARAVGLANGRNPISIIVPCHRVVGSNGLLVGYAGGLVTKQWLLDHERAIAGRPSVPAGYLPGQVTQLVVT
jgi:methylated-DNA-[protein]-cysteine S-methyltransferase